MSETVMFVFTRGIWTARRELMITVINASRRKRQSISLMARLKAEKQHSNAPIKTTAHLYGLVYFSLANFMVFLRCRCRVRRLVVQID